MAHAQKLALLITEFDARRKAPAEQDAEGNRNSHFCSFLGGGGGQSRPVVSTPVCRSTLHWSAVKRTVAALLARNTKSAVSAAASKHRVSNKLEAFTVAHEFF